MKKIILLASTGLILAFSQSALATDTIKIGNQEDPFQDEMGQKFNDIFNGFFNKAMNDKQANPNKRFIPFRTMRGYPRTDMFESADNIEVSIELPGIKKEDVDLQISQGVISISYQDKTAKERKSTDYTISERTYGSFQRQISIPNYADVDKANAEYRDGILYISIPKLEEAKIKAKKIEIK